MKTAIVNFNGGEFSSKIDARSDTEKYVSGCRVLENMIPLVFGGTERRPGTEYISRTAVFGVIITDIVAYENVASCYEHSVVNTKYDNFLSQFYCWENDVVCNDDEVIVSTELMSEAVKSVCGDGDLMFYENEVITYE